MMMYERTENGFVCCPLCDRKEQHANTLHYHIKRDHDKNFDHPCKYCSFETYMGGLLTQHIKNNHPDKFHLHSNTTEALKVFTCPFCDVKSTSKGNLKTHMARIHAPWIREHKPGMSCSQCCKPQNSATSYYYHCLKCVAVPGEFQHMEDKIKATIK